MPTRIVEGQLPYTGGTGIEIDANKVISILLREENNLIEVNGDNELYTDLQLAVNITPSSDFPVGVTVGKVLQSNGWTQNGLIINWKTTSGDYARWLYGADGELYFDGGQGTWKQVYYSAEVDALFTQLRGELATVAFTGDYNDLINRPAFFQVQADWEQTDTTSPDFIKNKPTIPTVNDGTLTIQKNGVGLGTFTANSSTNVTANITVPNVINNLTSTSTSDSLSAYQGKQLNDQIETLKAIGRFLSLWDCEIGMPISFPLSTPYNYSTGDYFLVENVDATTNYRPNGVQYTGTASTTAETEEVEVGDLYIYDGSVWLLQINHGKTVSFANLAGQPTDNSNLATALNAKQDNLTAGTNITISGNTISATDTTYTAGTNIQINGTTISATDTTYSTATSSTAGLVKLGSDTVQTVAAQSPSSTASRTYPVQLNSSNQAVVNVPWSDTTVGSATSSAAGTVKLASDTTQTVAANAVTSTASRTYGVQTNSNGQMVVNVPRTDNNTTYTAGTGIGISGTTISNSGVTSVNGSTGAVTVSEFSPSNAGTTDQVLTKTASGYEWAAPSGGDVMVSSQANNILTSGMKIWAGTQSNYEGLSSYDTNTVYLTIE